MREVFLTILRMGLVSGYVILVVLLVRLLLRRFPKRYSYLLWSVVFFRLACPFGTEGPISLIPAGLLEGAGIVGERDEPKNRTENGSLPAEAFGAENAGAENAGKEAGASGLEGKDAPAQGRGSEKQGESDGENPEGAPNRSGDTPDKAPGNGSENVPENASGKKEISGIGAAAGTVGSMGKPGSAGTEGKPGGNNGVDQPGGIGGADSTGNAGKNDGNSPAGSTGSPDAADKAGDVGTGENAGITDGAGRDGSRIEVLSVLCAVWVVGVLTFWLVWARSIRRFRKRLAGAMRVEDRVYESEQISASFVDGIFRPVIYLAPGLSGPARQYVLCHERVHVRRRDPLIKAAALFLVSVYWFHPLVWLAFRQMCRDMEMSCDERVVELLGVGIKKEYSGTLLQVAQEADEVSLLAAFGGNEVKSRVKNVLSYRKPKKWLAILLLLTVAAVGIGLGLNPGGRNAAAASNNDPGGNMPKEDSRDDENAGMPGQDIPGMPGGQDGQDSAGMPDNQDGQGDTGTPDGRDGTDAPDNQDRQDVSGTSDGQGGTGMPDNQDGQDGAGMPDNQDGQGGAGTPDGQGNQSGTDPESTKPDPAAGYASVLNQYRIALKEEWEPQRLTDEGLSILTRYCYDGNARENVGFAFLDVDGDGEAELLIGAIAGDPFVERQIFELYTLKDGAPKQVFSGRERSRYYLCEEEDGSFIVANEGSLSAADSEWDYYTLQDGELSLIRTIVSWHVEAGADAADGRLQGIMEEEEAEEFVKVHEARYMKIEYTPFMDFDNPETKQLRLILSQKELWELKGDYLAPEVAYAVTDLDRNGRLELIAEACQGTGIYTYFWIYEVSEDGESLVPCGRTLSEEYDSQADIMTMSPCVPMYYNPQTGQRNYIFIDGTKDGAARYYESQWALSLQNGYLTEQCLASMATEYENAGADVTTTYRPGEWKDIRVTNQEEYRTAGDRAFDGWQKEYASIGWFGAPEERENAELTQWAWLEEMEESYDRFYTQVKEPAASRPQEVIEEEFRESWKQKVTEQGYSEQEAADWYARFQREGMVLEEGDRFSDVCIGDFDNNGITDCFFAVNKHETMDDHVWWYRSTGVVFWGSMNGEAFYCREVTNDCIIAVSVVAGDVNHDGLIELVLGGDTGGCGGGGCIIWQMLQYRDGQIVELKIPADENWHAEENTSGYRISVYETEKTRTCRAVLEADGREVLFTVSGDSRWDYASMLDKEMPGWRDGKEPYGGNGRSYTGFEIVTRDGKDYLLAKEYLQARTAYGGIGFACLLFDWDENGSVYVKDFYVEPF